MEPNDTFIPQLTTTDWNREWMRLQDARKAADDAAYWDKRAQTFHKKPGASPYVDTFIEYMGLEPTDSVFDMGCGNGALSIPLAVAGHEVIAADFSRGMLDSLEAEAARFEDLPLCIKQFSWSDDWASHGVTEGCVNVSIASRSIATHDLQDSLVKLSSTARKRCCITLPVGSSPRTDANILSQLGLQPRLGRDFVYAFMILVHLGYLPEVRYIPSIRRDTYDSSEEAFESLSKMVIDATRGIANENETRKGLDDLRTWVTHNIVENPERGEMGPDGLPQKELILKTPRKTTWAFISWNTHPEIR